VIENQGLWHFFAEAGIVVKSVMVLLVAASIMSWTYIFQRAMYFNECLIRLKTFQKRFWNGNDLSKLYMEIEKKGELGGIEAIFHAGFKEFIHQRRQNYDDFDSINRAMHIAYANETEKLEKHLPFLASVGSTTPYVGLFGTVWGIMSTLQTLGNVQQATIAMVAPGISEALIATAMGLFAAIPAVLAYNKYATKVDKLTTAYETFQEELTNILQHQRNANEAQAS
jgi:biopolymer transport protein TolQ